MQKLKLGLSEVDCKIAERLEKLREDRKQQPVPTEEEVARRLAKLKGEDPATVASLHGNRMVLDVTNRVVSNELVLCDGN